MSGLPLSISTDTFQARYRCPSTSYPSDWMSCLATGRSSRTAAAASVSLPMRRWQCSGDMVLTLIA